jgi:hypothetical protein
LGASGYLDSAIQLQHDIRTGIASSKLGYNIVDENSDHTAGCQFVPLPHGGAVVTCPPEAGAVKVDSVNPYLGIGVVIFIVVAIALGLKLITARKARKPSGSDDGRPA